MPLSFVERLSLSGPTVLMLVGIAVLFLVVQERLFRRVIRVILSSAPARPDRPTRPVTGAVTAVRPAPPGLAPTAPEPDRIASAPSVQPPASPPKPHAH